MSRLRTAVIAGTVVVSVFPAVAQAFEENPHEVAPVVVVATRAQAGISQAMLGASLTVLSSQDLAQRQVRVISDVLRDIPGISVGRSGGVGNMTQIRIRGSEANHVLMLIDGVEASDPFMGEFDYAALLADDTARIEVMRGQQGALYGSDAIAGVINYLTPSGRELAGIRLRIEGGSFDTFGTALRVGGAQGGLDYVFSGAMQGTGGYPTATFGSRNVGSDLGSASLKLGYDLTQALTLKGGLRWSSLKADSNGQDYATGYVVDTPGAYATAGNLYAHAGVSYDPDGSAWSHSLLLQSVVSERNSYTLSGRTGGSEGSRLKASYVADFVRHSGAYEHRLSLVADVKRETFQNTAVASAWGADTSKRSVNNTGLVAQYDAISEGGFGAGLAVRHDINDRFRDATTYRLHGFWNAAEKLRLRAAVASGIKNPGQTELFGYNASAYPFVGNPNLKPERSQGWEAGGDWTAIDGRFQISATYFNAHLKDEIYGVYGADPQLCAIAGEALPSSCQTTGNRQTRSHQSGIELWGTAKLSKQFMLDAAYTYLDAKEGGVKEIRRPAHIASVNATLSTADERGLLTLTARYNGEATDTDFAAYPTKTVTLPRFVLVNLSGRWKVRERVELFGRIENLFDEKYQEVLNYRGAGRAAYAGLRLAF